MLHKIGIKAYKLGSGEIDNLELLKYIARKKKPMILGCGSCTMKDVEVAVKVIKKAGNNKIILLQCVTNYPSPVADANLRVMNAFQKKFKLHVGYSDHTIGFKGGGDDPLGGITVPLAAVALGGVVIEKHFTDDRKRKGPDHPFAIEIPELKKMIDSIRAVENALGSEDKTILPVEKDTVIIQRRSIYAKEDIQKGQKIKASMLEYLRPAIGLRPPEARKVLGKVAKNNIPEGSLIKLKDVSR